MVAVDGTTAWDLKPNRENSNQIFNVLCNVVPTPHPWTGAWYRKNIDLTASEKQQFWFEKCKWLKRCKLYEYDCSKTVPLVESTYKWVDNQIWLNSNFTDVTTFQWYRIFLRKSDFNYNPYSNYWEQWLMETWGDGNEDTCDTDLKPSEKAKQEWVNRSVADTDKDLYFEKSHGRSWRTRLYIQQIDEKTCSWETFDDVDESPIVLVREYSSSPCNPDRFVRGYGGIGVPRVVCNLDWEFQIAMIYYGGQMFAYLYSPFKKPFTIRPDDYVYLPNQGIYLNGLTKPSRKEIDLLSNLELPENGYFIPQTSELTHLIAAPNQSEWKNSVVSTPIGFRLRCYSEYGEIPYIAVGDTLYSINGFFMWPKWECQIPLDCMVDDYLEKERRNITPCRALPVAGNGKRVFVYDQEILASKNQFEITWFSSWGARLAYIANWGLYISGTGIMQWVFWADLSVRWDLVRGYKSIPAGITDLREMYTSLLLFWPRSIYALRDENAVITGTYLKASDVEDWYYAPWSYFNDDWEFLIVRKNRVLETMDYSSYYGTIKFTPDTWFFVNSHIKGCNPSYDNITVDATINHRYISIYDNNHAGFKFDPQTGKITNNTHYSKLLIYDKHYNVWYHWIITWARVTRVKDWIFLWDGIYSNKGRTWWWETDDTKGGEIIEIISAYVWEEWLQTPKFIQYVKTAIGDHSSITNESIWTYEQTFWGERFIHRVPITNTRYPQLLDRKDESWIIKTYDDGWVIYWHGKLKPHTLMSEILTYQSYDSLTTVIDSDPMTSETTMWMYASVREAIWRPANLLELTLSAKWLDNVQFGSFYISYYVLDADYEHIENTNIMISDFSDRVDDLKINKWEYCQSVLAGSAC